MTIVVDSNILVALTTDATRGPVAESRIREWNQAGNALHAPTLFRYEIANALTRLVVAGQLDEATAGTAWAEALNLPVELHELEDGDAVMALARTLRRRSAYDAAYIALAQQLGTEVWTFDGPLARNAAQTDLPVRLIEVPETVA